MATLPAGDDALFPTPPAGCLLRPRITLFILLFLQLIVPPGDRSRAATRTRRPRGSCIPRNRACFMRDSMPWRLRSAQSVSSPSEEVWAIELLFGNLLADRVELHGLNRAIVRLLSPFKTECIPSPRITAKNLPNHASVTKQLKAGFYFAHPYAS